MNLYAICLNTAKIEMIDDWWIELYWADDPDHAEEQALDTNPDCAIVCVGKVPRDYTNSDYWKEVKTHG